MGSDVLMVGTLFGVALIGCLLAICGLYQSIGQLHQRIEELAAAMREDSDGK